MSGQGTELRRGGWLGGGGAAALLAALLLATPAQAQVPPPTLPDARASRTLALGELIFPGSWRPGIAVGGLYQISLAPMRTVVDEGIQVRRVPSWYLHLAATAGYGFDVDGEGSGGFTAKGGAGLLHRPGPSLFSAAGPVLLATEGPRGWGAGLRGEVLDNIGVQMGWLRRTEVGGDRLLVSVDIMRCLLQDLGLGPCIGLPR